MRNINAWLTRLLTAVLLMGLAACSEHSLYSGLSEQEANEIVAELSMAGLKASKQKMKGKEFSVSTPQDQFAEAVQLLKNSGLPRQHYDTLGEVFAKEGFVSSPLEERARLNHALSQEIAATLSRIDGVILARVHLAVPARNDLNDTTAPASASVFVKHRTGVNLTGSVTQIKALVVNGIENLPYENVTVALFESTGTAGPSVPPVVAISGSANASRQMSLLPASLVRNSIGVLVLGGLLLLLVIVSMRVRRSGKT